MGQHPFYILFKFINNGQNLTFQISQRLTQQQIIQMAQLQEFFDSFTCKVCFQLYGTTRTPFVICYNHHLLCNNCVRIMMDRNQEKENGSTLECPFCKDHMKFTNICQDRQILHIKGIVAKVKRQEENQRNQIAFLRKNYEKLEEENRILIENPCSLHVNKESQKRLVCYCKNKYFSNPIEQIKAHIESISQLMKLIKRKSQGKVILGSILQNQPDEVSFCLEAPSVENDWSLLLSQRQEKVDADKLEEKFQQLIKESLKNIELMDQMLEVYRKRQTNSRQRQKQLDEQLKEKEEQFKMEAEQQITKYKKTFEQMLKFMVSSMKQAEHQHLKQISILNKEIKEKNDEIQQLKKENQFMQEKCKQTLEQMKSKPDSLQADFLKNTIKWSHSINPTGNIAYQSENDQKMINLQPRKIIKRRSSGIQNSMLPGKTILEPNIKEQRHRAHSTQNSHKNRPPRQSKPNKTKQEGIMSQK